MKSMESRLRLAFLCVVVLLAVQGVVAYRNIVSVSDTQQRFYEQRLTISDIETRLSDLRLQVFKLLGTLNPQQMDLLRTAYDANAQRLRRDLLRVGIDETAVDRHFAIYHRIIQLQYDFSLRSAAELVNGPSKDLHESLVSRLRDLSQAARDRAETRIAADNRRTLFITFGLLVLALATAFVWAFVLSRTLTDRKKAEAERERLQRQLRQSHKMEAVGTLAGGIAHEFNNLLSIIVGNAELAREDIPADHPAQAFVDEIYHSSLRGRDVVKQLLAFTRPSAPQRKVVELGPIAADARRLLRASMPASIRLDLRDTAEGGRILGDPTQIHQVIINLCNNAAHALEETGGRIEVRIDRRTVDSSLHFVEKNIPPGEYVRLQVTDDGPGIPSEHLNRVFDPFFTTKDVGQGTGMGLTVVHGIIKAHAGGIRIESPPAGGTAVSCYFPASADPEPTEAPEKPPPPPGRERLLIVDDEPQIAAVARMRLERLGYRVEAFTDPQEAVSRFEAAPDAFDLVLTDWSMPAMNGDRLIRRLRELRPDIRTIVCTGYNEKIDDQRQEAIGANGLLLKPTEKDDLAQTVRRVLDRVS